MIRTLGPAQGGSSQVSLDPEPVEEPAADPSLSSLPSVQIPPSQIPDSSSAPDPAEAAEVPFLSRDEKRRILAQIVRTNTLDCFDDSGAFDVARARRVLPPGAIRGFVIHETTRTDQEGKATTQRRIHVRLVDPLSALRLDDLLERRADPARHSQATSRASFNALRKRTMEEDDTNQSIALLKQALSEADDRELQLSQKLEEKDQQLAAALSPQPSVQIIPQTSGSAPSTAVLSTPSVSSPSSKSPSSHPSHSSAAASKPSTAAPSLSPQPPVQITPQTERPTKCGLPPAPSNSLSNSTPPNTPPPPKSRPRPPPSVPDPVPPWRVIPPGLCTVREF